MGPRGSTDRDNPPLNEEEHGRTVGTGRIHRERRSRHFYKVKRGRIVSSTLSPPPTAAADRLYLVNVSGIDAFRSVYDALSETGFYNLNPEAIRDLQPPESGRPPETGRKQCGERAVQPRHALA